MGKLIASVAFHGLEIPVLDQRDPKGAERMHTGEAARLLHMADETGLSAPTSTSGRDLRDDLEAHSAIASLTVYAADYFRKWREAGEEKNTRRKNKGLGGSVEHLPVAIVVSNFGAHVACDKSRERVSYF